MRRITPKNTYVIKTSYGSYGDSILISVVCRDKYTVPATAVPGTTNLLFKIGVAAQSFFKLFQD